MNKKNIDKTMLFFCGIWSRMKDNSEFFEKITIVLKSGAREYTATVFEDAGQYFLDYLGEKTKCESSDFLPNILREYDGSIIIYSERGTEIIIESDEKNVRFKNREKPIEQNKLSTVQAGREYLVSPSRARELLKCLGILGENGKIKNDKVRKYNQIDYFLELTDGVLKNIPKEKELLILDCACGKSYLSFVMNFYFTEILRRKCRFVGVDFSEGVINSSREIADSLGYKNMKFVCSDLAKYVPESAPDLVVSLHACDTLTDMALAFGIKSKAKAIMSVPCCHKDVLKHYSYDPFSMITKHGILKARLADTLTDGLRASYLEAHGYNVSLIEYISPLETPKNIMIRASYTGKQNKKAEEEYNLLKTLINVSPAIEKYTNM